MSGANDITLMVDGKAYGGWKSVDVRRSLEQVAGGFHLEVTTKWDGQAQPYQLREGLPCEVLIGSDVVITGFIDDYSVDGEAQDRSILIQGRDKTADLVDCSAIFKSGQWRSTSLLQIVKDIAQPFGLSVVVGPAADLGEPFKSFALQEGELAFDAIDRACRMRAVLCTSTPAGELLLTQASTTSTGVQLIEGVNIEAFSATHSWAGRFSKITMKGQGKGDDDESGAEVAHAKAEAKDAEINRYRPLVVVAEHGAGLQALSDRAKWEVKVRMGRGKRGEVTVTGWRTGVDGASGALWAPNQLVYIDSPSMNLAEEMLIVGCRFTLNERSGKQTALSFTRREALELIDAQPRKKLRGKKKTAGGQPASWSLDTPGGAQ